MRFFLLVFLAWVPTFAADVCFKTAEEYKTALESGQLPKILQELPLFFTAEQAKVLGVTVSSAGLLQIFEGKIRFYFSASSGVDAPIKEWVEVCANSKAIKIKFANNKVETVKIDSDTSIKGRYGLPMSKTDKDNFFRVARTYENYGKPAAVPAPAAGKAQQ